MSKRFDQLTARHRELRQRVALQRGDLALAAQDVRRRLHTVDRGVNALRSLARNPLVIAAGLAAVALIGPRRMVRWASHGALLASTAQRLLKSR
ncbi:MAG TPA: YqjK family protein [Steroidobacter sp.]|jgi:hypothetical protein|nr:YqjK family protein [Steroidobacteraceae bacterium]HLS82276.1 YqjK family protein [Steroidobacter sp.]